MYRTVVTGWVALSITRWQPLAAHHTGNPQNGLSLTHCRDYGIPAIIAAELHAGSAAHGYCSNDMAALNNVTSGSIGTTSRREPQWEPLLSRM